MDREDLLREAAEEQLLQEAHRRRFLYKDVEELVLFGSLTTVVPLAEGFITLGSMTGTQSQWFILRSSGDEANWKRHHIAHSVRMVNGFALDQEDPNTGYHLFTMWLRRVRTEFVEVLHTYVLGLRRRQERAIRITNAFCQEPYSRSLWRTNKMVNPVNTAQRLWVAYNQNRDDYEQDLKQWQHTRSIVGSMSGKGAKQLKKSTDQWERRREDASKRTIEDAVNWIISGDRAEQKPLTVTVNGQTLTVPKVHASQTVDEMQEELMRAVRGEKDYHDHMVDQYKAYHRARNEAARKERQDALAAARKASEERGISGSTTIVGYTPEQLAEIDPSIMQQPTGRRQQATPERERFDQYLDTTVGVGWIGADGRPEKAGAEGQAPSDTPPKAETLQDKISRRKPRLKS
jgi:hypothetical protein